MTPDVFGIELVLLVPQMDREHREMINHAQSLRAAVTGGGMPRDEVQLLLKKLIDSVKNHFASEEELMLSSGYHGCTAHRKEHKRLLDQVYLVEKELPLGTIQVGGALACFVEVWMRQHILGPDKQFALFLNEAARHGVVKAKATVAGRFRS
jgi:hemerythrin-like metal-binding protein